MHVYGNKRACFFRFWGILLLSGEYSVRGDGGAVPDGNGNKPGGGDAASVVGGGSTVYGAAYPPIYSTNPAPAPPSTIGGGGGGVSSRPGSSASGKQDRLIIYRRLELGHRPLQRSMTRLFYCALSKNSRPAAKKVPFGAKNSTYRRQYQISYCTQPPNKSFNP